MKVFVPSFLLSTALAPPPQEAVPTTRPAGQAPASAEAGVLHPLDRVVAIVGDEAITETELERKLAPARETFGFEEPARWEEHRHQVLRDMVLDRLLVQAAKRRHLDEGRIEERVQRQVEEEIVRAGGKTNLLGILTEQGKTYEDFLAERRGEEFRYSLYRHELGLEPGASGRPSIEIHVDHPGALRAYWRTHRDEFVVEEAARARYVFLAADRYGSMEAARRKAEELRRALDEGADFEALAREHSDSRAAEGGDLGWVSRASSYDKAIVGYALAAREGDTSPPIELARGFAIVGVEEVRPRRLRPFEDPEVQEEIAERLWQEKKDEYLLQVQRQLLRETYVWPPDLFLVR